MVVAAPRMDPLLIKALRRLDDPGRPIAETHRRLGEVADRLELTRPSYQAVRVHVHAERAIGASRPSCAEILLDVSFRVRSPEALLDLLE
jgi:hypothetical protein